MPELPITIYRSLVGQVIRLVIGGGSAALVFAYVLWLGQQPYTEPITMLLGFGACIVILLVTVVSVAVYSAPKIVLTDQGIEVQNWASLFASTNSTCDWSEIEVITVKKPGPLAGMFGYGTILVQTAGVQTDLTLTYVPRVDYWAEFIDSRS